MAEQNTSRKQDSIINLIDQGLKKGVTKLDDTLRSISGVERSKNNTEKK